MFHNIFSKKSETLSKNPKKRITIIIDNREKNSLVPSFLSNEFDIEFKQLPVADYLVNNIAIERKTLSDLKSSIINKRIVQQLLELKQYPKHLLIIEGFPSSETHNQGIHENALRGFLLSVATEFQVPIIFTENAKDTALYIQVLAKKVPKESSIRASKILLSDKEQAQFILEGFPNIGPKTAKELLKKFKSLKSIFSASELELSESIGKKSESISKFLNKSF